LRISWQRLDGFWFLAVREGVIEEADDLASRALLTTLILSMNWLWVRKATPKRHRTTRQISRETGIRQSLPYRSSEFQEASCARTHYCKLCFAPNSRTKTATSFLRI